MSKMSCQCKDHNYRTNLVSPQVSTEFDRNALLTLENYGGYNDCFFLVVFRLAEFLLAAFRLMLKIFGLAGKFGGLGVYFSLQNLVLLWYFSVLVWVVLWTVLACCKVAVDIVMLSVCVTDGRICEEVWTDWKVSFLLVVMKHDILLLACWRRLRASFK